MHDEFLKIRLNTSFWFIAISVLVFVKGNLYYLFYFSPKLLEGKDLWGKESVRKTDVNKDEYCKQPKITRVSRDTSIRVGQNIMLQCIAEGWPCFSNF